MADGYDSGAGSIIRYLDSDQGRNMDPVSFVCVLGLLNVYSIVNLIQSYFPKQAALPAVDGSKKPVDQQMLAQTISGLMSGQGGQKINPGALMGLFNMLSSHMDRGPSRGESRSDESSTPARLEPRSEQRRAAGDPGERDGKSAGQK